jgi:flagellar biosynthesis anti-sigma factor FlgM
MKILTGTQQPTIAQQAIDSGADRTESGATQKKTAAKPLGDKVDFSAAPATELKYQQELQAKRVESIKSLVKAGKYQVSSRDVAQKMLSGNSGS